MPAKVNKVNVQRIEIHRADFVIEVPAFKQSQLEEFFRESLFGETDQWIGEQILSQTIFNDRPFKACFRRPEDFGLSNKLFFRVWEFNEALHGKTLSSRKVIALCYAISQLPKDSDLYRACGACFHVMSAPEDAGKYRDCSLYISSCSGKPIVRISYSTSSPLYFNPTSHYGVLVD